MTKFNRHMSIYIPQFPSIYAAIVDLTFILTLVKVRENIKRGELNLSILEPALAQKFIDKTAKHLEYNINIMNDEGIIIASKDETRVGSFHEVAFKMLEGTRDTGIVNEDQLYLGTKPGVNLFIDYKNKHVGVICVSGNPDTVHAFANLVKTSMEAMLEYELQMDVERRRKDKTEQFLYYLLFEEHMELGIAEKMANKIELNQDQIRACIVIRAEDGVHPNQIINALSKSEGHSHYDLIGRARNDDVIVFKALGSDFAVVSKQYTEMLKAYIDSFIKALPETCPIDQFEFFVGSLQNQLKNYRNSYVHALDMSLYHKGDKGVHFFQNHVMNYYRNKVTMKVYYEIFNTYDQLFTEEEKKQLVEIVEALRNNNYNVVYSAKELFIHRNTMIFRLNKLKESLNLDPISNADDREFLNELGYYFKNKR